MNSFLYKILNFILNFNIFFFQKILSIISFDYNFFKKELNDFKKKLFFLNKKFVYLIILFLVGSLPGKLQLILSKELNINSIIASEFNSFMLFFYSPFPFLALIQILFSVFNQSVVNDAAKIIFLIFIIQLSIRLSIIFLKKIPVGFLEYELLYFIITFGKKENYITKNFENIILKIKLLHKKYSKH